MMHMTFTALDEDLPGPKWQSRWRYSWPAYRAWLASRHFKEPSSAACLEALQKHMPQLVETYKKLLALSGGGKLEACFLSHWQPPEYLSGCSIAAKASHGMVRLVRNYDLSPELNEGLLLKSRWQKPVMGMVEFLWGLSDGMNAGGLCAAIAYGGRSGTGVGFGVTLIVRYILEICSTVEEALDVLARVPSHMAYNVALADCLGNTASVELQPGGGLRHVWPAIATNHQSGPEPVLRHRFTETHDRRAHLQSLLADDPKPDSIVKAFLLPPLFQRRYEKGFGTLFTAEYDPCNARVSLHWQTDKWTQSFERFHEHGGEIVRYSGLSETRQ
jgi:predicted choloylglycine hydrolase